MNDARERDLGRRLRSIDRAQPFDAEKFAERIVAERSRRQRRRVAGTCSALLAMVAIGASWRLSRPELSRPESQQPLVNHPNETVPSPAEVTFDQRMDEIDAVLTELIAQEAALKQLNERVARSEELLAAARKKREEQELAFLRAEASEHIEVPDLTRFYVDETRNPLN